MRKRYPNRRTVLSTFGDPGQEYAQVRRVVSAEIDNNNNSSRVALYNTGQLPSYESSALLFNRPIRSRDNPVYSSFRGRPHKAFCDVWLATQNMVLKGRNMYVVDKEARINVISIILGIFVSKAADIKS